MQTLRLEKTPSPRRLARAVIHRSVHGSAPCRWHLCAQLAAQAKRLPKSSPSLGFVGRRVWMFPSGVDHRLLADGHSSCGAVVGGKIDVGCTLTLIINRHRYSLNRRCRLSFRRCQDLAIPIEYNMQFHLSSYMIRDHNHRKAGNATPRGILTWRESARQHKMSVSVILQTVEHAGRLSPGGD